MVRPYFSWQYFLRQDVDAFAIPRSAPPPFPNGGPVGDTIEAGALTASWAPIDPTSWGSKSVSRYPYGSPERTKAHVG